MDSTNGHKWNFSETDMDEKDCSGIPPPPHLETKTACTVFVSLLFVAVLTVCLNTYVIVKINRLRIHKPITRFLITSLAFTDLLVGMVVMPFNAYNFAFGALNIFSGIVCDIVNSFDVLFSATSIQHLSILTFERYVGLCMPFSYKKWCSVKVMATVYIFCFTLNVGISFGILLPGYSYYGMDPVVLNCFQFYANTTAKCSFVYGPTYMVISNLLAIVFPMIIVVFLNFKVLQYIRDQSRNETLEIMCKFSYSHRTTSIQISKVLAVLTGCFLICWLPFIIVNAVIVFADYTIPYTVYTGLTWLGYLNSGINPILYLLFQGRKPKTKLNSKIFSGSVKAGDSLNRYWTNTLFLAL